MTILCFCENPGGANGIITLAMTHPDVHLCAAGSAVKYMQDHGCILSDDIPQDVEAVLVATSHSVDSEVFRYIDLAREKNVPSFGYVDACVNAENRFRGRTSNPLAHAPDYLFVTEEAAYKAFCDLGFDPVRIFVVGNPRYDFVDMRAKTLTRKDRKKKQILFLADPLEPQVGADYKQSGFDARSPQDVRSYILLDFLAAQYKDCDILIKLHPRNTREEFVSYQPVCEVYDGKDLGIDLAFQADIVIGTTTSLLVESALIGVPTVAALLTPRERWWLPHVLPDNLLISESQDDLEAKIYGILGGTFTFPMPANKAALCCHAGEKMLEIIKSRCL